MANRAKDGQERHTETIRIKVTPSMRQVLQEFASISDSNESQIIRQMIYNTLGLVQRN